MSKLGRNDPCRCGSGKKYKQCCLLADEAARLAAMPPPSPPRPKITPEMIHVINEGLAAKEALAEASNIVARLIKDGRLDEAEKAAHQLLERYPEVHDGYDRIGMVYEARGENLKAAEYYRKAAAFIRERPGYETGYEEVFDRLVAKLDPSGPTTAA